MRSIRHLSIAAGIAAAIGAPALAGPALNQPHGDVRTAAPPPTSVSYSAVVAANAKLVRGKGATAAQQAEGKGTYEVDFASDVTGCAYAATVGEIGSKGSEPASFITVVGRSGVASGIFISTYDVHGNLENLPFHVDVGC